MEFTLCENVLPLVPKHSKGLGYGLCAIFKRKQTELTFCNVTRGLRPSAYIFYLVSIGGISPPTPCLLAGVAYGFDEQGGVCAFLR